MSDQQAERPRDRDPVAPGGNTYNKYESRNPAERWLVAGFLSAFRDLVRISGARSAVEVGCGEGYLAAQLARLGLSVEAVDPDPEVVARAARERGSGDRAPRFAVGDLFDLAPGSLSGVDLLVCCEVLEHVAEPAAALDRLAEAGARRVLVSVPREPLWRVLNLARGRYWRQLGNTPGHRHHWSSDAFAAFVGRRLGAVAERRPVPWTMILAAPHRPPG